MSKGTVQNVSNVIPNLHIWSCGSVCVCVCADTRHVSSLFHYQPSTCILLISWHRIVSPWDGGALEAAVLWGIWEVKRKWWAKRTWSSSPQRNPGPCKHRGKEQTRPALRGQESASLPYGSARDIMSTARRVNTALCAHANLPQHFTDYTLSLLFRISLA